MENIKTSVKGSKLTIVVDLSKKGKPSASGKTIVIASSRGNKEIPDTEFTMGLNIYKYNN